MDKKTYKPFIILTIIAFLIACAPFILWGYIEIMAPGWTTHCPAGGYCGSGHFEKKLLNNILNSLFTFIVLSFLIWIGPIVKFIKRKNNEDKIRKAGIPIIIPSITTTICLPLIILAILLGFRDYITTILCPSVATLSVVSILATWITYLISNILSNRDEKQAKISNKKSRKNSLTTHKKTNLIESEKNTSFFLFSTVLSGVVVAIMIVIVVINAKTMLSASRSGVGGMGFVTMIPSYIIIMLLEVIAAVFSIIVLSRYRKLKKNGIEPTKRLRTLRKVNIILFIIILCWPVCFTFVESLIRFFSLQT